MALLISFHHEAQIADFNVSNRDFSNHTNLWIRLPTHEIVFKILALLPIMILGVLGNVAIIVVMIRVKGKFYLLASAIFTDHLVSVNSLLTLLVVYLRPLVANFWRTKSVPNCYQFWGMRTCTNIFICNMALADLMTILCCSWTIIVVDAYQNFILGKVYCRLDGFFHVTFLLASVFSLIIISGDRLLGIVFPFSRRLSHGQAWVIVIATWVAAMMCASPTAIWRWLQTRDWHDYEEVWCNENGFILKYYWLMILILLVYMPLTVMAVAYTVIILQLDKYEHQLFLREHPLKMKYRKKVIKVLFMYVLNYLAFWVLFQVVVLYRYFKPPQQELPPWYRKVYFPAHLLTYAQSAINPIIYGVCNESFRKAFRITFRCLFKKNKVRPTAAPKYAQAPLRIHRPTINKNAFQNGQVLAPSTQETELKDTPERHDNRRVGTSNPT